MSGIDEDENYLNLCESDGGYHLADKEDWSWGQTEFTKNDIRNLVENWDVDLDDFDIVEVSDEQ